MNLRWGITPNLTMNGTINPDFSQVESDAGQFSFDPRQALFFPEKRPFFLDGIEQFATPNNLIYTRRVVAPIAATKITGKVTGRTNLAYLAAVDDAALSATGDDHPVFNILRVQQDVGAQSRAALVYTDRIDGDRSNRVIASDARFVWKDIYSLTMQGAMSRTSVSDAALGNAVTTAPLWQGVFARAGRRFGMRYTVRGVDPDFRAAAGFISRTGIASGNFNHQVITYGKQGSALERWSSDVVVDGTWQYDELMAGRAVAGSQAALQQQLHVEGRLARRRLGAVRDVRLRPGRSIRITTLARKRRAAWNSSSSPTAPGCRISITCFRPRHRSAPASSSMRWCCGARTRTSTSGRRPTSSS